MTHSQAFDHAVATLKEVFRRATTGDPDVADINHSLKAREEVIPRYQQLFARANLSNLTEEQFREFLQFRNNRHWKALQRMGPAVCADMDRLRQALRILLDESRPINKRLNELVPADQAAFVPRLSKAILTPILLISHPDRYGVWNQVSENAMKSLGIWPDLDPKGPFGDRYEQVNHTLNELAATVGVDLWTLDGLWWRIEQVADPDREAWSEEPDEEGEGADAETSTSPAPSRFGLEKHLQAFLRDNWSQLELGQQWVIYEEDGDPEAGYEYPCGSGRIDILARHRTESRWLVIELKRDQSSDKALAQIQRYMGWVKLHLAGEIERVEGLVIARQSDERLRYALAVTANIRMQLYQVQFELVDDVELVAAIR